MRKKSGLTIIIVFFFISCFGQNQNPIHILPQPVELKTLQGEFLLKSGMTISYGNDTILKTASWLKEKLAASTGYSLNLKPDGAGEIALKILGEKNGKIGPEGYKMEVSESSVQISANTKVGLFYGIQTLLQLFPAEIESNKTKNLIWKMPCLQIMDYPRFGWRGMMLDVSRHFFTKDEVKRYIEEIARYKFNSFHWHLTDDNGWRLEIKSLPKLTSVGARRVPRFGAFNAIDVKPPLPGEIATDVGFYTQEDVREIIAFAKERGVQVIPEIDIPGHCMAAIAAYPELCCTKDTSIKVNPGSKFSDWFGNGTFKMHVDNSLNPSDEKVYQFLDKVFTEIAQLFPAPYIHVGGDECYKGFWAKDANCKALMHKLKIRHVEDLQGYFMNRVKDIIQKKGKKVIGWDEVMEGGMSNEATIMFWRGFYAKDILPEAKKGGYKVIMSPTTTNYFDYFQGDRTIEPPIYANLRLKDAYTFDPTPEGLDDNIVLGGQSNLWTEQVQNFRHAEYMTFPRAWATSEILWSPKGINQNWGNFVAKVESHFKRAEAGGIKIAYSIYDPIIQYKKEKDKLFIELSSELPDVDIYYTLDESMPDDFSIKYKERFQIPQDAAITLRLHAYRNGKPIGHLITVGSEILKSKMK